MKAILINADERKITAVDAGDPNTSLERLRELIGCEWVQPVVIGDGVTIWVDEEAAHGWLPPQRRPLRVRGQRRPARWRRQPGKGVQGQPGWRRPRREVARARPGAAARTAAARLPPVGKSRHQPQSKEKQMMKANETPHEMSL